MFIAGGPLVGLYGPWGHDPRQAASAACTASGHASMYEGGIQSLDLHRPKLCPSSAAGFATRETVDEERNCYSSW